MTRSDSASRPPDPRWPRAAEWLAAAPDGTSARPRLPRRTGPSDLAVAHPRRPHAGRRPRRVGPLLHVRRLARRGPVRAGRRGPRRRRRPRQRRGGDHRSGDRRDRGRPAAGGLRRRQLHHVRRGARRLRRPVAQRRAGDAGRPPRHPRGRVQRLAGPPPRGGRARPAPDRPGGHRRLGELPVLRRGGHRLGHHDPRPARGRPPRPRRLHARGARCRRVRGSRGLRRPRRRRLRPRGRPGVPREPAREACRPASCSTPPTWPGATPGSGRSTSPRSTPRRTRPTGARSGWPRSACWKRRPVWRAAQPGRLPGMRTVVVTGDALTVEDVVDVARGDARAELGPDVAARMERSRRVVTDAVEQDKVMYGVTTGFGALADTHVGRDDLERMQLALVRSHAAGVGTPLPDDAVRGLLLLRARTLTAGYSGVRVELPRRLLELLDLGLLPVIPGKGSVGASGDLAQLAHLAQPLVGEGRLRRAGDPLDGQPSAELLAEAGPGAADARRQGGPVPDQRHRADAGAAVPGDQRDRAAGQGRRHRLRDERRVAARHRPRVRRARAGDPAAPGPARQRGQPAPAAGGLTADRLPPGERPRRTGLVLPALCAAGARRGARRAVPLPPRHRHRARLDRRQPGDRRRTAR